MGWRVLADAIADSDLVLTAAFPLWADGHSPGHGHAGNLEYDLVICCRKASLATWLKVSADDWLKLFPKKTVQQADRRSWQLAQLELNNYAGE